MSRHINYSPATIARRRTYDVWRQMLKRCEDPCCPHYRFYGARGITVCTAWHQFRQFLADMGVKPDGYSIDREDVNGAYEPSNCAWIPLEQQASTRRSAKRRKQAEPRVIALRSAGMSQEEIAAEVGLHQATVSRVLSAHGMRSRVNDGRKWRAA